MKRQKNLLIVMIIFLVLFLPLTGIITAGILKKVSFQSYEQEISDAQKYYREKNYWKAIECYEIAHKRKESKDSEILVPLANSYQAVGEYDQAARVLEEWYQKSGQAQIKIRLGQMISMIKHEKYEKAIQRGKLYLEDDVYEKAIYQFQEAVQQEPDRIQPVELLVSSYIAQGNTEMADKVCLKAKQQFSQTDVKALEQVVVGAIKGQKYEELLKKAEDLYHQESYEECFSTYKKAIEMYPKKVKGYQKVVKAYQSLKKYDDAIQLLQNQAKKCQSGELRILLQNCKELKSNEVVRCHIFEQLYDAFTKDDMDQIVELVSEKDYEAYIGTDQMSYYSKDEKEGLETVPLQKGLVIDQLGNIYCGSFKDGERSGHGAYFSLARNHRGYHYYTGEWRKDLPNGEGLYYTTMSIPYHGRYREYNVTVAGTYVDGQESGRMERTFYQKGRYFARLRYHCMQGIPQPVEQVMNPIQDWGMEISYQIGNLAMEDDTSPYYYTKHVNDLRWGVEGLNPQNEKD